MMNEASGRPAAAVAAGQGIITQTDSETSPCSEMGRLDAAMPGMQDQAMTGISTVNELRRFTVAHLRRCLHRTKCNPGDGRILSLTRTTDSRRRPHCNTSH
jgi:hypothetical protein